MAAAKKPNQKATSKAQKPKTKAGSSAAKKSKKTPVKRTKQKTKIDWVEARHYYLRDSTISYADVGKQFKVSKTTVEKRGKAEGWVELRQELGEKAYSEFTQKLLDDKTEAQSRHLQHYRNLQALANSSIQSMANHTYYRDKHNHLVLDKDKNPIPVPINTFELEKLAKSLKIAIDGERVILGIPTSVSAVTDKDGGNVWEGFAEMMKAADEVLDEAGVTVD